MDVESIHNQGSYNKPMEIESKFYQTLKARHREIRDSLPQNLSSYGFLSMPPMHMKF